jgi:DNA-binding MarR family transcriptional regulator
MCRSIVQQVSLSLETRGTRLTDFREGFSAIPRHLFGTLTIYELGILAAIHSRYPNAYPSHELLAHDAGTSVSTVQRTLKTLEKKNLVRVESGRHDGRSNVYILTSAFMLGVGQSDRGGRSERPTGVGQSDRRSRTREVEQGSRTTESIRAARGGQDGSVKIGNLSDDVEMPESGVAPAKKAPAKTGTHAWAKAEFGRLMRAARCGQTGTTQGVLNSAFKRLRDEGYSNEEIVSMAKAFFTRHDQEIRAKRTEIDPSVMFVQRLPQLKAIKAEEIENKRAGVKTSFERSTEIQREAMKRLGITEESA